MRVLHHLAQLRASGAEQMLRVAAPHWQAAGLDMDVLETTAEPGQYREALEAAGYRALRLPLERKPADVTALRDLYRAGGYDVIHIHTEGADLIPVIAGRLAKIPGLVRTVHHIHPYEGFLRYRKITERMLVRALGAKYVCNSRSGSANETKALHNPHRLVFNWYDEDHFRPPTATQRTEARAALGLGPHEFAFVSVGGCAPYKNHDLILQALARTPDVLYLHAGPEVDDSERRLAVELGVGDRARFLGVVPDVLQVFHAADGYLMPSTIEGFGVAAAEAMGCGVPTILSDRPALSDFNGMVPGAWVPLEMEALAVAMQTLASTPAEQRRAQGSEASRVVRELFGTRAGADGYLEAYKAAIRQRGRVDAAG